MSSAPGDVRAGWPDVETGSGYDAGRRRQERIDDFDVLGKPPARDLVALVELAAQVTEMPAAAISLITETELHHVATAGFEPLTCARDDSLCDRVLHEPEPVVVPDMLLDPRFRDHPLVTGEIFAVRFYANARLVTSDGVPIGTLCVFDTEPRSLTPEQHGALQTLADRVVGVLELRLRTRQLEASLEELTGTRDELRRSNQQLAAFAGQVSHDLRTPLTSLVMCAELLAEHPSVAEDDEATWMVERTLSAGQRMATMIRDLLAYARVGGGLGYDDVDLALVVTDVLHDLDVALSASRTEVLVKDLPTVRGDEAQLRAVLQNLVSNAAKFVRPGIAPRIAITSRRVGRTWRMEVTDNGVGIAPDQREAIFELLARGDHEEVEGSGIGLATCKRILNAHGGEIGVTAAEDGGTVVWFELPDA